MVVSVHFYFMRRSIVVIVLGWALFGLASGAIVPAASAQHQAMVSTIDERQLSDRLRFRTSIMLIDVRMPHERTDWTIRCEGCTIVTAPYDFDNDSWTVASAGERYITKVRANPNLMDKLKRRTVVVVCLEGVRAEAAANAFAQLGLTTAVLVGGLNGLKQPRLLGKQERYR